MYWFFHWSIASGPGDSGRYDDTAEAVAHHMKVHISVSGDLLQAGHAADFRRRFRQTPWFELSSFRMTIVSGVITVRQDPAHRS